MKINNAFKVDLPPDEAWATLLDIPRVVPCMPGAEYLGAEDEKTHKGKVTVKLGPVTVAFQGKARLEEIDAAARRVRMKASGNELKGRGSAQADVVFQLAGDGAGTRVSVATDLGLAGAVAQYGRAQGVIADVAQVIIDQFAENLRKQIAAGRPASTEAAVARDAAGGAGTRLPEARPVDAVPAARPPSLSLFRVLVGLIRRWLGLGARR